MTSKSYSRKVAAFIVMTICGFLAFACYCFTAIKAGVIIDWRVVLSYFIYMIIDVALLDVSNSFDKTLRLTDGLRGLFKKDENGTD